MTPGDLRLRAASPADLAAAERIERASFDDPWVTEALLQELTPSALRFPVVAESGAGVVGFLLAWRSPDQMHILNVAVDPAQRRRGIGALLLAEAVAEARRAGLDGITLEVRPGNEPALALYRRFGFREEGVRRGYYADTGEDALILTLDLAGHDAAAGP